jgi:quinol monooxygenase YgiN
MKTHHVLLYRFKPGVDRIDEHLEVIRSFRDTTEGLIDLQCGRSLCDATTFTHGFIMTFESPQKLEQYNQSEAHDRLVNHFKEDMEDKLVYDFCST